MKTTDKIISTLYLAASDRRENILQSIVEKILFDYDEFISFEDLYEFIKVEFSLEPIYEEVTEAVELLKAGGKAVQDGGNVKLSKDRYMEILSQTKEREDIEGSRYSSFLEQISTHDLQEETDVQKLWTKFNEYIYSCFLVDGKDAIYSFLPNKEDTINDRIEILRELKSGISEELYLDLVKIINDYPQRINHEEIEYLNSVAEKTESFYALGVEEEVYKSAVDLKLDGLLVFTDTNVLFTVLDIHNNPQDRVINELIEIALNAGLGLKFQYLPITLRELNSVKNELQRVIQRIEFQPGHIKALLASGQLDGFTRHYYEKKLESPDAANPIYVIEDSRTVFASRGIGLYNRKFDFYEDDAFIDAKVEDYREYETFINKIRGDKGLPPKHKGVTQVTHDIQLREAILYLRDLLDNENTLKYLGITLDYQLLRFDKFLARKRVRRESSVIQPVFMSPGNFLRRIRAFLPVKTDDYKKAFISAMTNLTLPTGSKEQSINVQKTTSYFRQIGIQDEAAILNIVKNELLYKELLTFDNDEDRSVFIQSEVDKYLEELRIAQKEREEKGGQDNLKFESLAEELSEAKQREANLKVEKTKSEEQLQKAQSSINDLAQKLERVKTQQTQMEANAKRKAYIEGNWQLDIERYRRGIKKILLTFTLTVLPIVGITVVNEYEQKIDSYFGYNGTSLFIIIIIGVLTAVAIVHRLFFDKELAKESWTYLVSSMNRSEWKGLKDKRHKYHSDQFDG